MQLCVEGDLAAVRRALQEGANPNAANKHGETALMQALAPMSVAAAVGKSPEPAIKGAFWMWTLLRLRRRTAGGAQPGAIAGPEGAGLCRAKG